MKKHTFTPAPQDVAETPTKKSQIDKKLWLKAVIYRTSSVCKLYSKNRNQHNINTIQFACVLLLHNKKKKNHGSSDLKSSH